MREHIRKIALEFYSTRFRQVYKQILRTRHLCVENYVLRNISQCFNCYYLWSFPDLIMFGYLLQHIAVYRLPKKPTLLAVYHVSGFLMDRCTPSNEPSRGRKKPIAVYRLYGMCETITRAPIIFLQCMRSAVISRSMFRQ